MKNKQWEPEAFPVFYRQTIEQNDSVRISRYYPIEFRIIRERDFQRLLRLARKAQTAKRTP